MNIIQLIESGNNVTLAISASDLREFGLCLIAEAERQKAYNEKDDPLLSAEETARIFGVSSNSLWRWGKSGYLQGVKVGRKVFYRQSEIDKLLKGKG